MTVKTHRQRITQDPESLDLVWDALEALSEGIAIYDANHTLVTCNQRYMDMYPLVADLIKPGAVWEDLVRAGAERGQYVDAIGRVEEWIAERKAAGERFKQNPEAQNREIELTSGQIYFTQFSITQHGGFVVTNSDITQRKRAEAMVRERENILSMVLETSPIAIVMARLDDGKILYRSPHALAFLGNIDNAAESFADPSDKDDYVAALKKSGRVDDYHLTLLNADGKRCATASWGRLTEFEGDIYAVTAVMDQSEKQAQEALIRRVLEACPAPIQMTEANSGEVLFSSPETIALFGSQEKAMSFYADSDTRARYLKRLQREGSVSEFKAEYINSDGDRFWGAVSARLIRYDGRDVIVSHTRDLTDQMRIEAELAQQQDQLFQNEKMSAMGELLAGVAHELNNPLSVVVGHALMLSEDCSDPKISRQVNKISGAAERCAKIVKTFLTMARQQPVKMLNVDINEIVQTATDVAGYGNAGAGLTIASQLAEGLPKTGVDPDQITQVVINLILNAEQAMKSSGIGERITVSTRVSGSGERIEIFVEDDGPGIPENLRGRIFEPFFTTKDVGDGTGIGLALCHRIIQTHDGSITLDTPPGGGAVFKVSLPLSAARTRHPNDQSPEHKDPTTTRILILDDEADVAELNAEILERDGYQVDVFSTAAPAIESLRLHNYDLILSDLHMPEIDGRGFFEIIKDEFPEMITKTGFVTGDTMGRSSQSFLKEANRPCVEKPVSPKELRSFVAKLLVKSGQDSE